MKIISRQRWNDDINYRNNSWQHRLSHFAYLPRDEWRTSPWLNTSSEKPQFIPTEPSLPAQFDTQLQTWCVCTTDMQNIESSHLHTSSRPTNRPHQGVTHRTEPEHHGPGAITTPHSPFLSTYRSPSLYFFFCCLTLSFSSLPPHSLTAQTGHRAILIGPVCIRVNTETISESYRPICPPSDVHLQKLSCICLTSYVQKHP